MSDDQTTRPTLETLLERINTIGETLASRMDVIANDVAQLRADMNQRFETIDQRFNAVDDEIARLRKDVERGFRTFERKLGYLANELVLQRRAEQDEIFERIEALENKAS